MTTLDLIELTDQRKESFLFVKNYLDNIHNPFIVETGCVRAENDFSGAGSSTLIWDAYVNEFGGHYLSIDITPDCVEFARNKVLHPNSIICSDSVLFLKTLSGLKQCGLGYIDVLYLDSYDLNPGEEHNSALHHIFELMAVTPLLQTGSLVMVDDNPDDNGKGKYIKQYMDNIGNKMVYQGYQYIWSWR